MNQGSYDLRRDVDRLKNKTDELAKDYYIQVNSPIVTYKDEVYTPSTIVATAYQSSREITDFYDDGILDLWVSTNGGNSYTYVKQTTSHTISAVINDTTITNYRINLYDEELNLLDRQTIVIVRTTKGSAGQGYDFIYYTTEKESLSQSDYPSGDITKLVGDFNEWLQSPKAIDTLHPNVFMSYRTSDDEGHWGNWSTPVKYNARGERGEDGEGLEMIFCRTQYADDYSLDPSTLNPVQTDDYVPSGWTDDQKGVSSTYCFEYVSMRTKEVPTGSKVAQWGRFSPPKLWATFSEDGKDGKGIELIFARNNDPTTAPSFRGSGNQRQDKKTYTGTDPNGKHFSDDDYVPYDWTDDQTGVDEDNQCEWVAKRIKKVTNGVASWESFNAPQLWATFSEDGEDGKDAITVMLGNEAQLIAVDGNDSLKSNPTVITIPVYCYKGITRVAGTISLSGISNTFSTKTITRQPSASNDGLITLQCTSVPSQITKDEPITITVDGKTYTKYFTWSKIGDGKDGNAGGTFDFVYYTKNDATTPTISSSTTINANTGRNVVGEWCARPTNVSSSYQYCFGAYRELDYKGDATGNYSDVYIWAKYGVNGSSGTSHEYAYYTTSSATAPTKPTGDVTATSGLNKWTTVPVTMDATNKYMYISYRINGRTWSTTALWSKFGEDGQSITDVLNYYGSTSVYDTGTTSDHNDIWSVNNATLTRTSTYSRLIDDVASEKGWIRLKIPTNTRVEFDYNVNVGVTNKTFWAVYNVSTGDVIDGRALGHYNAEVNKWYSMKMNISPTELISESNGTTRSFTYTSQSELYLFIWLNGDISEIRFKNFKVFSTRTGWYTDITQVPFNSTNKYLWSKEVTKAGNNVVGETTPIMIAEYSKGGQSISSITEEYALSTDTSSSSIVGSWSSTPLTMTATNKYLWNRETINYSNPSSSQTSTPKIIGAYGDKGVKGDTGAKGKDGEGLEHIFYLTNTEVTDWSQVTTNKNPQRWAVQPDTPKYIMSGTGWTDDATGVDGTHKFEYCSIRTKTPNSSGVGKWGAFGEPSLWAKFGEQGEKGEDGEGLEMIFCRTTTPNGYPSDPSTLPANPNPDYVPSGWTDDQTGVDVNNQYEYVCMRTKIPDPTDSTGKSLIWDIFSAPKLWAKFGEDGEQGIPGVDGDGVSTTGVMTKVANSNLTNTGVGSMSDSVPSDYVASTVYSENFTKGSASCVTPSYLAGSGNVYVERQGNIVTVSFNNLQLSSSFPVDSSSSGHQNMFTLPNWAKPSRIIYFASVFDSSVLSCSTDYVRIRRLSSATNMTGTVTYMVDGDVGKANTTLSFVSTSAVNTGGYIQAKILSGSTPLDGVILYFRVNDVVYKRITGDNGIASLNINLPSGSYPVVVWFDGGEYDNNHQYNGGAGDYKYAQAINTFTVNKASTVNITFDSSNSVDDNHYAQFNNTASGSYPIRNHTVYLNVGGSGWRSAETDNSGRVYFRLNGYTGSTTVQAKINASSRVTTGKTSSKTYTIS